MKKYSLGIDYGTQSCRAVIVDIENGIEIAQSELTYPHKVMQTKLPSGKPLGQDWALQHPSDYLYVLENVVKDAVSKSNISKNQIIGIGVDFTACTILPIDNLGNPLTDDSRFIDNPHAYVKLWKHHAAQKYADQINIYAKEKEEDFLKLYGGKISSEWMIPKVMQIVEEDIDIYNSASHFIEAGDWIVYKLTGKLTRSSCFAGYKGQWNAKDGYLNNDILKELNPKLDNFYASKVNGDVLGMASKAGELTKEMADLLNLEVGTPVATAIIDAHAAVPAAGISSSGKMLMIMGTSTCHLIIAEEQIAVPGIAGVVYEGILPGYYGYEAGQACVGDHFEWMTSNLVPKSYHDYCQENNVNIHEYLSEKAGELAPGETGLLALDWWNGNRSVLVDADLTGLLIGMDLNTLPEHIYKALIEATAFGTRVILDTFEKNGIKIDTLYASGGISKKNKVLMQMYADILNRNIYVAKSDQAVALGSAIFGSVVAGENGHKTIEEAIEKMGKTQEYFYKPNKANNEIYNKLYDEYLLLHDYFGRGENNVMKRLKEIKRSFK